MKKSKQKEYHDYLLSDEWKNKKKEFYNFLTSSGLEWKCDICGSKKKLSVHHQTYNNIFNEDMHDLQLVCNKCHVLSHGVPNAVIEKVGKVTIISPAKTF
jgi:hypothetical protein